jgi:hypothetical protein
LRKFDYHNKVERHRRLSRRRQKFHEDHLQYATKKHREFCDVDMEFFWWKEADYASLNMQEYNLHSSDVDINRRCHRFTGTRSE